METVITEYDREKEPICIVYDQGKVEDIVLCCSDEQIAKINVQRLQPLYDKPLIIKPVEDARILEISEKSGKIVTDLRIANPFGEDI